jgi:hypothetical protein
VPFDAGAYLQHSAEKSEEKFFYMLSARQKRVRLKSETVPEAKISQIPEIVA